MCSGVLFDPYCSRVGMGNMLTRLLDTVWRQYRCDNHVGHIILACISIVI